MISNLSNTYSKQMNALIKVINRPSIINLRNQHFNIFKLNILIISAKLTSKRYWIKFVLTMKAALTNLTINYFN